MFLTITLALAKYARLSSHFGWEEVSFEEMHDDVFVHQNLTNRACRELWGAQPGEHPASSSLEWHTDYIDSYLYNPLFWAGGITTGDGLDRLKVATSLHDDLVSLHFDDLTSVEQIEMMWTRYLSGCVAGLFWAANRDDVPAAHNILGATLHAIQDFYAHSSWVDDRARREKAWHEFSPLERSELNLYTGSYEADEHLSQRAHGKVSLECSLMRAVDVGPVMEIACAGISPLNKLTPCEIFDRCRDAEAVRTNVLGVQLPQGLVYVDPPGIALDSSWQAEIARQVRDIPADDPITARKLYENAKDLAVRASVWWVRSVGDLMAAEARTQAFWARVMAENTYGSRHAQFEDFSRLPLLFVAHGPYPPTSIGTDWDWYLRLQIRTASETDSGTNGSVTALAGERPFLLDYGKLSSAVVEYNDFSTGDVQSYLIGPLPELPDTLTFSVEGNDVGDILTVIWEGFVGALKSVVDTLGDFFMSVVGGHADFVAQRSLQWSPDQLAGITYEPLPFREFLDGDDEGQYNVYGSIRRIDHSDTPRRHSTFEVRIDRLECWEESTEASSKDEPFLLALLINLADHDPKSRVQPFRTSPASLDDGESTWINHAFTVAHVPDGHGMLALPIAVYESDQESAAARDELLRRFAREAEEETQSWSDRLIETVGATFGSDWKLGGLEVYAFNRAPVDARAATIFAGAVEQWVEAGSSHTIQLDADPGWVKWSLPPDYRRDWLTMFSLRAEAKFEAQRFEEATDEIRAGIGTLAELARRHREISLEPVRQAAEHWLARAAAAHPHDAPRQVAAAANSWEITSRLADVELADGPADSPAAITQLEAVAEQLRQLVGLLSPDLPEDLAVKAADKAREIWGRLPGDWRYRIALTWLGQAAVLHPQQLERQRAAAANAYRAYLELAGEVLAELAGGTTSHAELAAAVATQLDQLAGLLDPTLRDTALAKAVEIRNALNQ
jgi:hypothetical protein